MNIYLVRHAQSESNVNPAELHLKTNMAINLSPLGVNQALEAGVFMANRLMMLNPLRPDDTESAQPLSDLAIETETVKVWNSPYNRTRQTAEAIIDALKLKGVNYKQEESIYLSERQFGLVDNIADYDNKFQHEAVHYQMHKDQQHDFFVRPSLGESPFDMCMRLDFFIRTILALDTTTNHVIVSHGAAIRGFLMMYQKNKYETYTSKNPANASVREIRGSEYIGEIFVPTTPTY